LKRLIISYLFFFLTTLGFLFLNRSLWIPGGSDFSAFYAAGSIVRSGDGSHLYEVTRQAKAQEQFTTVLSYRKIPLLYPHAPFETVIFAPLAFFSYKTAFLIWWAINHVFLFLCFVTIRNTLTNADAMLPVIVCCLALFFPLQHVFVHGQDSILLLLLLCIVLFGLVRDREFLAGAALAAGFFKPQLTLPIFLLLAVRSSKKFTAGFFSSCVALLLLSFALVGYSGVASFVPFLFRFSAMPAEVSGSFPSEMANIRGLLYRVDAATPLAITALSLTVLVAFLFLSRKTPNPSLVGFAVAVALVVSYHSMSYDLTILLLPFVISMDQLYGKKIVGPARVSLALAAFAMMWTSALQLGPMWKLAAIFAFASVAWVNPEQRPKELVATQSQE
jgi:hypothetical protein